MPSMAYIRDQDWLLPPSLGELIPVDHPVRFVAELVDLLDLRELGIRAEPAREGRPSYPAKMLLACWIYGFMSRVRSTHRIERACHENIPFMWLSGQLKPDHVTLSRFYKANRRAMRPLFKRTVRLAIEVDLVDFSLQAVDGTKVAGVSRESLKSREQIGRLLQAAEEQIAAMEKGQDREPAEECLPSACLRPPAKSGKKLQRARERSQRLRRALETIDAQGGDREDTQAEGNPRKAQKAVVSVSDPEAVLMKGQHGYVVGYNGQAVVDSKAQVIVASDAVADASDVQHLVPMVDEVEAMAGRQAEALAADAGFHSASNLQTLADKSVDIYMPDPQAKRKDSPDRWPYHKEHFIYHAATDTYTCLRGKRLTFCRVERRRDRHGQEVRIYQCHDCEGCPAWDPGGRGHTRNKKGRTIKVSGHEEHLRQHREKMKTDEAREIGKKRSGIVEPVFAVIKQHMGLTRFWLCHVYDLLRGLDNVRAEWRFVCAAYNLRKIWTLRWRPRALAAATAS